MRGRIICLGCALLIAAGPAAAQGVTLSPSNPKNWDAAITAGWLGGDKHAIAERYNDWYDTFALSVDAGRYWTPHLKTEIGATLTTEGTVYSQRQVSGRGGIPVFFSEEHRFSVRAVNLSAAYQFLDNQWAHPFLSAGVQLAWEREQVQQWPLSGPGLPVPVTQPGTDFDVRPFISGGSKFYVSEQGFFRTDLSAAFDSRGAAIVWWRIGGGFDF